MALCRVGVRFRSAVRLGRTTIGSDAAASRVHSSLASVVRVPATRSISTYTSAEVADYDIVVVGAGLVGAAFTCALKLSPLTAGLKVALLDRVPLLERLEPRAEGYIPDARVSTITPASESFLKSFGGWSDEAHNFSAPFDTMQVWDSSGLGHVRYTAADAKTDFLGRVTENNVLQASMHQIIKDMPNLNFLRGSLSSIDLGKDGGICGGLAKLKFDDGTTAKARLVVGSDGGKSKVRELAGIRTLGWRYNHYAVVSTVKTIEPFTIAYQRFLPTGPIALLPSGGDYANIVWSTTPSQAVSLAAADAGSFSEAVRDALSSPPVLYRTVPGEILPKAALQQLAGDLGTHFAGVPEIPPQVIDAP
eukprot:9466949-Pyramimonas_sp.AAC.1